MADLEDGLPLLATEAAAPTPARSWWQRLHLMRDSAYLAEEDAEVTMSYLSHFLHRGHVGTVNVVAASETMDYIVTGGEDFTTRVWAFDSEVYSSYELKAVLLHDLERRAAAEAAAQAAAEAGAAGCDPFGCNTVDDEERSVTAVGCAGTRGPAVSATSRGDVYLFNVGDPSSAWIRSFKIHGGRINDLCIEGGVGVDGKGILQEEPLAGRLWRMVTASEDGTLAILEVNGPEVSHKVFGTAGGPAVNFVRCLDQQCRVFHDRIAFVSCTATELSFWSWSGDCKVRGCQLPTIDTEIQFLTVSNKTQGSLIFAGRGHDPETNQSPVLAVWAVETGYLSNGQGDLNMTEQPVDPVVHYDYCGRNLDVDQGAETTAFAADLRSEHEITIWKLQGVAVGALAKEPRGPVGRLVNERLPQKILHQLAHSSKVRAYCIAEDLEDAGGAALVVGCSSGTAMVWDLAGADAGEVTSEMRSMTLVELGLPVVMLLVTFLQVISFAFGPSTRWQDEVQKPMNLTAQLGHLHLKEIAHKIVELDDHHLLTSKINGQGILKLRIGIVIALIVVYLGCTIFPTREILNGTIRSIQTWRSYRNRQVCLHRPVKLMHGCLRYVVKAVNLYVGTLATLAVVPVFKVLAVSVDCVHPDGEDVWESLAEMAGALLLGRPPQHASYLAAAPRIQCFVGEHRRVMQMLMVIVPIYFMALIPYAVVEGDANYVTTHKVWAGFFQLVRRFCCCCCRLNWTRAFSPGPVTAEDDTAGGDDAAGDVTPQHRGSGYAPLDDGQGEEEDLGAWAESHLWREAAKRKATAMNRGYLHADPRYVFRVKLVEFVSKAALPVIVIETTQAPIAQMVLVTLVGALMFVTSVLCPPRVDRKFMRLEQGIRAFTLCTMSCGLLTTVLNDRESPIPAATLAAVCIAVPLATLALFCQEHANMSCLQVLLCRSSSVEAAQQEEAEAAAVELELPAARMRIQAPTTAAEAGEEPKPAAKLAAPPTPDMKDRPSVALSPTPVKVVQQIAVGMG